MRALVGIEPHEVRQVLEATRRWPRTGTGPSDTPVLTVWGRTRTGRGLIVALYHLGGFTWKILGARDMTGPESAEYTRWETHR